MTHLFSFLFGYNFPQNIYIQRKNLCLNIRSFIEDICVCTALLVALEIILCSVPDICWNDSVSTYTFFDRTIKSYLPSNDDF